MSGEQADKYPNRVSIRAYEKKIRDLKEDFCSISEGMRRQAILRSELAFENRELKREIAQLKKDFGQVRVKGRK